MKGRGGSKKGQSKGKSRAQNPDSVDPDQDPEVDPEQSAPGQSQDDEGEDFDDGNATDEDEGETTIVETSEPTVDLTTETESTDEPERACKIEAIRKLGGDKTGTSEQRRTAKQNMTSQSATTSATSSCDRRHGNNNVDLVFTGKNYEAWKRRQRNVAIREGYGDLLYETTAEKNWLKLSEEDRFAKQTEYTVRQEKAKGAVYDFVDHVHFMRIQKAASFRQIFVELDADYLKNSDLDQLAARSALINHTYCPKGDFKKFVQAHNRMYDAYSEAGGDWSVDERIMHLTSRIPHCYDPVFRDYKREKRADQPYTYERFVRNLYDLHDRMMFSDAKKPETSEAPKTQQNKSTSNWRRRPTANERTMEQQLDPHHDTSQRRLNMRRGDELTKYCEFCRVFGHDISTCWTSANMKTRARNATTTATPAKTDPPKDDTKKPVNWSKFRNFDRGSTSNVQNKPANKSNNAAGLCVKIENNSLRILESLDISNRAVPFGVINETIDASIWALCSVSDDDVTNEPTNGMVLDSGTKYHMLNDLSKFDSTQTIDEQICIRGISNSATLKCNTIGTVLCTIYGGDDEGITVRMDTVLYVPELSVNLLSVNRIASSGAYGVSFEGDKAFVYDTGSGQIRIIAHEQNGVKWVYSRPANNVENIIVFPAQTIRENRRHDEAVLYHRRFAHLNAKYLSLLNNMVVGIPKLDIRPDDFVNCTTCIESKMTRSSHTNERRRPDRKFELICSDILDVGVESSDGRKLLVTFIDAYTGFIRIVPIKKKSDIARAWVTYHRNLSNKWPEHPVATVRCDGAREYTLGEFRQYNEVNGIDIDSGNPYTPELNGISERKNRSILQNIRAMLLDSGVNERFWTYAASQVEYTMNRMPTKTNKLLATPYELVYNEKPNVEKIHPFGCTAEILIPKETRVSDAVKRRTIGLIKLGPVAKFGINFGNTTTGHNIYDPKTDKISNSCDVKFDDSTVFCDYEQREKVVKFVDIDVQPINDANVEHVPEADGITLDDETNADNAYDQEVGDDVVIDDYAATLTLVAINKYCQNINVVTIGDCVPKHYSQAITSPFRDDWINAMNAELDSHVENNTWTVVERPFRANLVKTLWVYTVKYDDSGNERAKARLVAFGCADVNSYRITETYASVSRVEYIRLIMSIIVTFQFKMVVIDVTTAFLYGRIELDIYVTVPDGIDLDRRKYALKLNKSLYGLRISSKCWQDALNEKLIQIGFIETCVRCVYKLQRKEEIALILTYVDDLLLASSSSDLIDEIVTELDASFRIKVNYQPKNFVGLDLTWDSDGALLINQTRYIERLARTFGQLEGSSLATPMEKDLKLKRSTSQNDDTKYRAIIGALLYVNRFSRPDVSYAVNQLSCHQGYVTDTLMAYALRVIRYVYTTRHLCIRFAPTNDDVTLSAYIDASHASDGDLRSISGLALYYGGHLVDWGSKRQRSSSKSSSETEMNAICDYIDHVRVPNRLLFELTGNFTTATVYEDNSSAIRTLDGGSDQNLRWAAIRAQYVKDAIKEKQIRLEFVAGTEQIADICTKPLDRIKFEYFRSKLLYLPDVT